MIKFHFFRKVLAKFLDKILFLFLLFLCNFRKKVYLKSLSCTKAVWIFFSPHPRLHIGAFLQFPFRWIYCCHTSKSTGKETGRTHLCGLPKTAQDRKFILEMCLKTHLFTNLRYYHVKLIKNILPSNRTPKTNTKVRCLYVTQLWCCTKYLSSCIYVSWFFCN